MSRTGLRSEAKRKGVLEKDGWFERRGRGGERERGKRGKKGERKTGKKRGKGEKVCEKNERKRVIARMREEEGWGR